MDCFDQFDLKGQKYLRNNLIAFKPQADPTDELISKAIPTIPIKETMTPVILFKTETFEITINKIKNLADSKLRNSFVIILSIFKTADIFRREAVHKNGCNHEWHNPD